MKKLFALVISLTLSVTLFAQEYVTHFLGIPVDGTKSEMIKKLKAKGFSENPDVENVLQGEFNGTDVNIHIVTNNNKVYRIMVCDAQTWDESNIKIRFNRLCYQFKNSKKYMPASLLETDYIIPDDEDISYEMNINKKLYEAVFLQVPESIDSIALSQELKSEVRSRYSEEQLSNPSDDLVAEVLATSIVYVMDKYSNNQVWLRIMEFAGKYYISIFYDNKYNEANGEDL